MRSQLINPNARIGFKSMEGTIGLRLDDCELRSFVRKDLSF